jgi:hypothetical protein
MSKKPDAKALLAALQGSSTDDDLPPARPTPAAQAVPEPVAAPAQVVQMPQPPKAAKPAARSKTRVPRSELKHIGGYLDDETVEKVALLRIRLKLENSDLLKLAIDDLYRKHSAKRAFGDA